MQIDFDDMISKIIHIYLDELNVYSKNRLDYFGHLRKVLMQCRKFDISLNPSKSIFSVTKGNLLGHIVSDSGISTYLEWIVVILNLPTLTSKKEVQAFMGIINFLCRFVPDFVVMVKPIHNILKKDRSFSWINNAKNAFIRINKAISSTSVLEKPYFEKEFIIYTNSIEEVVSSILIQCDQEIKFCSKIQSSQNRFKSNESVNLVIANPTQLVWVQTDVGSERYRDLFESSNR
jgi:hypothetical protein